jgi:phosphopantothenate-cysteine ligase/phosphopantothenoylcysteine decarboxylase/phosphopantothenate--cysteine ligase
MQILVTAGNTLVMIDRVRCLTNVFSGRTGAAIALCGHERGHHVTLLTSHPEALARAVADPPRWTSITYRTFADLERLMAEHVGSGRYDAIVHCAAVSDYLLSGVYPTPDEGPIDPAVGKIKSDEPELWLRLVRAPKLVDRVREPWGFGGILVKFKLEVGVSEEQLLAVAERSRQHSRADWMVANTLEGASDWAYLGSARGYERVGRPELPQRLLEALEHG